MANDPVKDALDGLSAELDGMTDVVTANNLLLDNLGEFMRTHANDAAAIRAMGDRLITDKQSISDAIVRNTPADTSAGGTGTGTGGGAGTQTGGPTNPPSPQTRR